MSSISPDIRFFLIFALSFGAARPVVAQPSDPIVTVALGTATPGGGFPAYGEALVATVREVDPVLVVDARATGGSTENVALLEAGKLDIALVQGEPANEVLSGGPGRAPSRLKVVAAMYATPGLFAVRADSPVRTIEDLRGRPVALGTRGSGLTILGRRVLSALGLDPDRDIRPVYLERASDGPEMVRTGRVAALWGGGTGWPGFSTLAAAPEGARFIGPSEDGIARILVANPTMRRLTVPAHTYRGQEALIETVGSWSLILSRPDLDEHVAFRLARALDRGRAAMARRLPQVAEATVANTLTAVPQAWLHPGAARYLAQASRR